MICEYNPFHNGLHCCVFVYVSYTVGDVQLQQATNHVRARYQHKRLVKSSIEQDSWPPFHARSFYKHSSSTSKV